MIVDLFSQRNTLRFDLVNCLVKSLVKIKIFDFGSEHMILAVKNDSGGKLILAAIHNHSDRSYLEGGVSQKCIQAVFNMLFDCRGNIKLTSGNCDAHIHLQCFSGFYAVLFRRRNCCSIAQTSLLCRFALKISRPFPKPS